MPCRRGDDADARRAARLRLETGIDDVPSAAMLPRLDLPGGRTQRRHPSTCCTRAALLVGLLVTLGTTLPAPVTAHWTVNGVNYTVYNATDMSNLVRPPPSMCVPIVRIRLPR